MRHVLGLLAMLMALCAWPALGQDEADWKATISGQIEALRAHDAAAALSFAGEGFRVQFEGNEEAFYVAVVATGYEPIVRSRSHSFGEFTIVSPDIVVQVVKLIGPDQGLYEAVYQLRDEPGEGWRVMGVALRKEPGIGA